MRKSTLTTPWITFATSIFLLMSVAIAHSQPVVEFEEELDFSRPEVVGDEILWLLISEDKYTLRSFGVEVSSAFRADNAGKLEPYVGVAFNYMDADCQVNARYSADRPDAPAGRRLHGVFHGRSESYAITERFSISGEVFYSPLAVIRPPSTTSQNDGLFNIRSLITYHSTTIAKSPKNLTSSTSV